MSDHAEKVNQKSIARDRPQQQLQQQHQPIPIHPHVQYSTRIQTRAAAPFCHILTGRTILCCAASLESVREGSRTAVCTCTISRWVRTSNYVCSTSRAILRVGGRKKHISHLIRSSLGPSGVSSLGRPRKLGASEAVAGVSLSREPLKFKTRTAVCVGNNRSCVTQKAEAGWRQGPVHLCRFFKGA